MAQRLSATTQDLLRLDAIAKHLKVKSSFPEPRFTSDVIKACLARVAPVIEKFSPPTGEELALCLGQHFRVAFEEVHDTEDIQQIEEKYLRGKKEIGFAQLREELAQPGVDALLFQRMNAGEDDADQWVAILNLQDYKSRAYFNRYHEIAHRIAEPPQQVLPFRRHKFEARNPVESLMDAIAGELAYYRPVFQPIVEQYTVLNFETVDAIRAEYAPSASLLSVTNAVVKLWRKPATALVAEVRGRVRDPEVDKALRVIPQASSNSARDAGLALIPNMRVPSGSSISATFQTNTGRNCSEDLGTWSTSEGKRLSQIDAYVSSRWLGNQVYALLSL